MLPKDRLLIAPATTLLKGGRELTLRMLEPADADALGDFYESVPREDYRHYAPHRLNRQQANHKACTLANSATFICIIGLTSDRRIAGYAWCDWLKPDADSACMGLCVGREFQSEGVGRALVDHLMDIARRWGPPRMHLTVNQANAKAFALYEKMGFKIVGQEIRGRFEEFPAEPVMRMELMLRPND